MVTKKNLNISLNINAFTRVIKVSTIILKQAHIPTKFLWSFINNVFDQHINLVIIKNISLVFLIESMKKLIEKS